MQRREPAMLLVPVPAGRAVQQSLGVGPHERLKRRWSGPSQFWQRWQAVLHFAKLVLVSPKSQLERQRLARVVLEMLCRQP